jgi:hypothetical protein
MDLPIVRDDKHMYLIFCSVCYVYLLPTKESLF